MILSHHPCRSVQHTRSYSRTASKSLPHTILANPLQLTSNESHSYKNHRGAWVRCLHSILSPAHFPHERTLPVNPLFPTHTSRAQISENTNTLSPALATHRLLPRTSCICHSYANLHPGRFCRAKTAEVYTNSSHFGIPWLVVRKHRRSFFSYAYKCPLLQTLSLDILTNARGVWGLLMFFPFNFQLSNVNLSVPAASLDTDHWPRVTIGLQHIEEGARHGHC